MKEDNCDSLKLCMSFPIQRMKEKQNINYKFRKDY